MEFVTGIGVILAWAFAGEKSISIHVYRISLTTISFIVTPFTYILNREVTKQIIVLENWMKGLRSIFLTAQNAQAEVNRFQITHLF